MNFTILSSEYNKNMSLNDIPKHKIIIDNGIEYIVCPDGKRYVLWALLEFIKS